MSDTPENPYGRSLYLEDESDKRLLKFFIVRDFGFLNCSKIKGVLKLEKPNLSYS